LQLFFLFVLDLGPDNRKNTFRDAIKIYLCGKINC